MLPLRTSAFLSGDFSGPRAMTDDDLALIPRSVRDKLDRVGIKLHLKEWEQLTIAERRRLVDLACESAAQIDAYRSELEQLVRAHTGRAPERLA
jgi:hypothetical protein